MFQIQIQTNLLSREYCNLQKQIRYEIQVKQKKEIRQNDNFQYPEYLNFQYLYNIYRTKLHFQIKKRQFQ